MALLADAAHWLDAGGDERPAPRIVVAEELDYHVLVSDVPLEVVAEIESRADQYPGVRIVEQSFREYPQGTLAAHVLGHLGPPEDNRRPVSARRRCERQGGFLVTSAATAAKPTTARRTSWH